jgi:hypothetical protein
LNHAARCYVLSIDGKPASFAGVLYRPRKVNSASNVYGISRQVTLPDYQGLGLAFVLSDTLGAAYLARGHRLHHYPAHPPYIRSFARSENWVCVKRPGFNQGGVGNLKTTLTSQKKRMASILMNNSDNPGRLGNNPANVWKQGSRQCAIFEYVGKKMSLEDANRLLP